MGTCDWDRAVRRLDRIMDGGAPAPAIGTKEAIEGYLADCRERLLAPSTIKSYRNTLDHLQSFAAKEAYKLLPQFDLEALTQFRKTRAGRKAERPSASTQRKEIEFLRAFFAFSVDRGWIRSNPAKKLKPPKETSPATLPFDAKEITAILGACDRLGNPGDMEARLRARAVVLVMLYSGLRISDVARLDRTKLDADGRLHIRTMKTGVLQSIPLPVSALEALEKLPKRGKYFFWDGKSKVTTRTGSIRRMMDSLKKLTAINVHPHRFRDTFAVELLQNDVPIRTVQLLLGHESVRTTERHYAHFVQAQQRLLDAAVKKLNFAS